MEKKEIIEEGKTQVKEEEIEEVTGGGCDLVHLVLNDQELEKVSIVEPGYKSSNLRDGKKKTPI